MTSSSSSYSDSHTTISSSSSSYSDSHTTISFSSSSSSSSSSSFSFSSSSSSFSFSSFPSSSSSSHFAEISYYITDSNNKFISVIDRSVTNDDKICFWAWGQDGDNYVKVVRKVERTLFDLNYNYSAIIFCKDCDIVMDITKANNNADKLNPGKKKNEFHYCTLRHPFCKRRRKQRNKFSTNSMIKSANNKNNHFFFYNCSLPWFIIYLS